MKITAQKFRELLGKYLEGRASARERAWLDEWFEQYRREAGKDTGEVAPGIRDDIREEILRKLEQGRPLRIAPRQPGTRWALAAVFTLAVACCLGLLLYNAGREAAGSSTAAKAGLVEKSTPPGQKLLVRLPDSTLVKLNSGSILRFPEKFEGSKREVSLAGEGYFEVAHDPARPFVVSTGAVKTTVLGTVFNVRSVTGSLTEVTLVQGRVNVQAWQAKGDSSAVILLPNQQAIVNDSSAHIRKQDVDVEKYIAWKNNTLYFENTRLDDAVKTLETWFNKDIVLDGPALGSCIINAKYQHETFDNVLRSLCYLLDLHAEKHRDGIILKGKGCGQVIQNEPKQP